MKRHRNPQARLPKRPTPDNFDPGFLTDAMTPAIDAVLEAALQLSVPARARLIDRMLDHLPPFERRGAFLELRTQTMALSTSERAELAASLVLGLDELIDEDKVMFAVALYRLVDLEQVDPDTVEELRKAGILARDASADVEVSGLTALLAKRGEVQRMLTVERSVLTDVLEHAAAATRILGHLDVPAVEPLADHVDTIAHILSDLLGDPGPIDEPVPSARSSFDEQPTLVHVRCMRWSDVRTKLIAWCNLAELTEGAR
jgi:hypothetical protein